MGARRAQTIARLIGRRIREERVARAWGQIDLAAHSHLGQSQVSSIETGRRLPSIDALLQIAEALDIEPIALLLDPAAEQRHRVVLAVLACSEAKLAAICKIVGEPPRRNGRKR